LCSDSSAGCSGYVISTSASDLLERLVSEMTSDALMVTLSLAQSHNLE